MLCKLRIKSISFSNIDCTETQTTQPPRNVTLHISSVPRNSDSSTESAPAAAAVSTQPHAHRQPLLPPPVLPTPTVLDGGYNRHRGRGRGHGHAHGFGRGHGRGHRYHGIQRGRGRFRRGRGSSRGRGGHFTPYPLPVVSNIE